MAIPVTVWAEHLACYDMLAGEPASFTMPDTIRSRRQAPSSTFFGRI